LACSLLHDDDGRRAALWWTKCRRQSLAKKTFGKSGYCLPCPWSIVIKKLRFFCSGFAATTILNIVTDETFAFFH
jgi:hypothetical protein